MGIDITDRVRAKCQEVIESLLDSENMGLREAGLKHVIDCEKLNLAASVQQDRVDRLDSGRPTDITLDVKLFRAEVEDLTGLKRVESESRFMLPEAEGESGDG